MAPSHADTAAAAQKQPRRPPNRIIPAIPHRFSRPPTARPITPEESTFAARRDRKSQPAAASATPDPGPTAIETPPTPDSRKSPVEGGCRQGFALANSPAHSGDDVVEETPSTQVGAEIERSAPGTTAQDANATVTPQPPTTTVAVNGERERPKPAPRAELPPEFYPREKLPPRAHVVDNTAHLSYRSSIHRQQPSVEGLVFGGIAQESPALPSTPQPFSRPPPGLAPPQIAPQFYPGHTKHPSDVNAQWPHPAYSMPLPPETLYANGNDFHAHVFPTATGAMQASFPAPFSPHGGQVSMNGITNRSNSQSPNEAHFGEVGPGSIYGDEPRNAPRVNGSATPGFGTPPEGYDIGKHVFNLFGNPEFTDYILHIRSPDTVLLSLPIHAVIASRSPVILEALRRSAPPALQTKDPRRAAEIMTDDRFLTSDSLLEAIKILYAAPLLPVEALLYGLNPYDGGHEHGHGFYEARKRVGQAISYTVAGKVLQIPAMLACGLQLTKTLLRWDTIDIVLHFASSADKTTVQPSGYATDGRIPETYAMPLLDEALEFIAYNFPPDFSLYKLAPELHHTPRLPAVKELKQASHNPRLSSIRFGDAPPEEELKPSHNTQVLSSILLSLPWTLLDRLFSHPAAANQVGWSVLGRVLQDVVDEREKRRQKMLQNHVNTPKDASILMPLLENLYLAERVEATSDRPSGFQVVATSLAARG